VTTIPEGQPLRHARRTEGLLSFISFPDISQNAIKKLSPWYNWFTQNQLTQRRKAKT
jgi:hypothetical protein